MTEGFGNRGDVQAEFLVGFVERYGSLVRCDSAAGVVGDIVELINKGDEDCALLRGAFEELAPGRVKGGLSVVEFKPRDGREDWSGVVVVNGVESPAVVLVMVEGGGEEKLARLVWCVSPGGSEPVCSATEVVNDGKEGEAILMLLGQAVAPGVSSAKAHCSLDGVGAKCRKYFSQD